MRRFTLLLITLSFTVLGFSQNLQSVGDAPLEQEPLNNVNTADAMKAGGDVFWSTTFDWEDAENPQGWSLPDGWTIVDNTEFGMPWVWR